jgi:hypothetical protein
MSDLGLDGVKLRVRTKLSVSKELYCMSRRQKDNVTSMMLFGVLFILKRENVVFDAETFDFEASQSLSCSSSK